MSIELRQPTAADVPALGQICYDAFKGISEEHGFESDFASVEFAAGVVGMLVANEQTYSLAAYEGATPRGSNHIEMWDDVAGVGPVSVDPTTQGAGIGRKMMEGGLAHAREAGFESVRLVQESFNMRSLALYASLGFDLKHPLAYMQLSKQHAVDPEFRPMTAGDIDAADALCREIYRIGRKNEIATLMQLGFPAFVIERGGRLTGYLLGTVIGHGMAEDEDTLMALINSVGASMDGQVYIPMRNGDLYRRALAAGHTNRKVMNLMTLGPYEEPQGSWVPSVLF